MTIGVELNRSEVILKLVVAMFPRGEEATRQSISVTGFERGFVDQTTNSSLAYSAVQRFADRAWGFERNASRTRRIQL